MRNKEKWQKQTDSEYNSTEGEERIGDTDFTMKKNSDGSYTLFAGDKKLSIPQGSDINELKKRLSNFPTFDPKNFDSNMSKALKGIVGKEEFDVDAAAKDIIKGKYKNGAERKAALGSDYAAVQNRVNEILGSKVRHSFENDSDYLIHTGILGQKWGVRKSKTFKTI